jgi:cytochrome b561
MQISNSPERYGAVPQALHWLTAAAVLLAWLLGEFGDAFPRGAPRETALFIHISAGLAVLLLVAGRLFWRIGDPAPLPEPTAMGAWLDRAGRLTHYLLYVLLVAVPVVGIVTHFARGDALPLFGLTEIASPWPADRAFRRSAKGMHELLANAMLILAGLHAAAALLHHYVLGDRTLVRMLPASWSTRRA